jgi:hypothetical protein
MSVVDQAQGAVKVSELATDDAQALLATASREDLMTVVNQLRRVLTDSLKRSAGGLLMTSRNAVAANPGTIAWTGTQLTFVSNTDLVIRLIQNESGAMVQLRANYGATDTTSTFNSFTLASGEVLYVELDRSLIPTSGDLVLENGISALDGGGGSLVAGKTIKKGTSGPLLASAMTGPSGTLSVPLAINVDGHLWWIPHGIYWPPGVSSPLGAVVTSTSIPVGAVVPFHTFGDLQAYGYTGLKQIAPGFQLADGSVIIDPQSPKFNPTRNPDGTPMLTYNSSLDKFTPNLNGEHISWDGGAGSWKEGDYVYDYINDYEYPNSRYVAIQDVPPGIDTSDTSYWQPQSTYNVTSPVNPYNKYRKTTQNQAINTYVRGNNQSLAASSASAYGGANTHQLAVAELPAHNHTMAPAGAQPAGTTGPAGSHNHTGTTGPTATPAFYHPVSFGGFETGDDGAALNGLTPYAYNHTHSIPNQPDHTHTVPAIPAHLHTINTSGGSGNPTGNAHNNEPRYHNILYIVRIF